LIGGLEHDYGQTDICAILRGDALNQRTLLALCPRRGVAAHLPVVMDRFHRALRRRLLAGAD
jgi:hypothetical protein